MISAIYFVQVCLASLQNRYLPAKGGPWGWDLPEEQQSWIRNRRWASRASVRAIGISREHKLHIPKGAQQWEFLLCLTFSWTLPFALRAERGGAGALLSQYTLLSQPLFLGEERARQQGHTKALSRRARWHVGHSKRHFLLWGGIIASCSCLFLEPFPPRFVEAPARVAAPTHRGSRSMQAAQGHRGGRGCCMGTVPHITGLGAGECQATSAHSGTLIHIQVACYRHFKKRTGSTYFFH